MVHASVVVAAVAANTANPRSNDSGHLRITAPDFGVCLPEPDEALELMASLFRSESIAAIVSGVVDAELEQDAGDDVLQGASRKLRCTWGY